ncbi:Zinc finger protein 524 [Merluccius polli]|uniref:Zinc finger protein 524 n=1 Tax=Merluccius polli TaxID=89951 RepID=A0AA47NX21_MERPO|nr:Zinc finger protein 524 [Merluccius polli]
MDSQLAVAQTSNSLDDQNDSQPLDESGPKVLVGPTDKTSPGTLTSNLQLFPITAVTSRQVSSINRETSALGGTSKPASLKTCKSDGLKQPIKVKTGMPVLNSQPIRIKIIVPQRGKNPIISTTTSLTKELPPSEFTRSAPVSPETVSTGLATDKNTLEILRAPSLPAMMNEQGTTEAIHEKVETPKAGSFDGEGKEGMKNGSDTEDVETSQQNGSTTTNHSPSSEDPLVPSSDTAAPGEPRPPEEGGASGCEDTLPLNLQKVDLKVLKGQEVEEVEEQTEPLDLSLPKKKRDADGRRCGRSWEDSGCESSLIMEVDEFEGEGDRDIVEEDDDDDDDDDVVARKGDQAFRAVSVDSFGDLILSPSFFSTSVFASLSSLDSDNDNFLFIDDQGIPYNLSPEGHKVPQIDTSKLDGPLSGHSTVTQSHSLHAKRKEPSQLVTLLASNLGHSLENQSHALVAPCDNLLASPPASATDSLPQSVEPLKAAELSTGALATKISESSKAPEPCGPSASETGGTLASNHTMQILTNPLGHTPIHLLSSPSTSAQFSSSAMGLSLPLSVTQNSAPSSTPMLLLLSSVTSSSSAGQSLALLDPSTGQLSQITAASSGPLSFPAISAAGQVSKPGSSVLSYPMIQLGTNNASVVLSGLGNSLTTNPVPLTSCSASSSTTTITLQTTNPMPSVGALGNVAPLVQTQTKPSDSIVEAEVISKEGNTKPSAFTSGSPPKLQNYNVTFDTLDPTVSESEPGMDSSTRHGTDAVPLDDHLYFSSVGGEVPPSPSIFTSSQLGAIDPLGAMDPLDPLSPASSPNSLGPRKVLYCQLCPRVFFYSSDLERHAITHSQRKPHVCQQCGKAFKRSSHLQRHKHIHTGQRNYVCPICAKRFREAGELQRHQRVHTGEKPYQCPLCHTRFAERNTLRRHTKRKHPYHQVAMEMLNERRGAGAGGGDDGGGGAVQQEEEEEESAEWYSSAISHLDNSESDMET